MRKTLIDKGIESLRDGLEGDVPQNLAYRILVSDVAKLNSTWQSIKLARKLTSPDFKPLVRQAKGAKVLTVGRKTPTKMFFYPILSYIDSNNNSVDIKKIYRHIQDTQVFTTSDLELCGGSKNEPRWKITVRWAKEELIQKGLLKRKSLRGMWEMTAAGKKWFRNQVSRKEA